MKHTTMLAAVILSLTPFTLPGNDRVIWLDKPAGNWQNEAFPLGNGRMGCMVFGGLREERIQFNVDSLWTGDQNPDGDYRAEGMGAYQNFGDLTIELHGGAGGVTVPSGHVSYYRHENESFTIDGNPNTKWCVEHNKKPVVWQVSLPGDQAIGVATYAFTSAPDSPHRDPRSWELAGSTNGRDWTVLDSRDDEPGFEKRKQKRTYTASGTGKFSQFRITFKSVHGGIRLQLGEIDLGLPGSPGAQQGGYRRELDIVRAECKVSYQQAGVEFLRETICSHPDQVIAVRLSASEQKQYSGRIRLKDGRTAATRVKANRMTMTGRLANGLAYEAQVLVKADGGQLQADGEHVVFRGCNGLTVYLAAGTSYVPDYSKKFMGEHPHGLVTEQLDRASRKSYAALLESHVAAHQGLFNRVSIDVGATPVAQRDLPMNQRLRGVREGVGDPDLEELLFQFGRYLLISSSRPGTLPANLQGLWNDRNNPAWHSDYHSNINLQMNYWGAEPANLAECHTPMLDMLMASREPFREGTRSSFGDHVRGFTIRTSHNPYGGMGWKWNIPASAWYARHFWEHYEFGQDPEYLKRTAYPYLKEVCQYWEDHLKALPDGTLVAPNGWSPEHGPVEDGVAHDQQIIWDLFSNFIRAADVLGVDPEYRARISRMRKKLAGPKIGRWGQLQEWMIDRDDPNTRHRHTSHLYAVFPGQQISRTETPDLAKAAAVSLKARGETGDSRREWAWTWRTALWARLGRPENCHRMITSFLKYNMLDNLIATHPPLQLDGSLGITGSMCEMLLQSHAGEVHLLPALPKAWATGSVKGLRARGGYGVDMTWKAGKLTEAVIRSRVTGKCTVRYAGKKVVLNVKPDQRYRLDSTLAARIAE